MVRHLNQIRSYKLFQSLHIVSDRPHKHALEINCVRLDSIYRHKEPLIVCSCFPFLGILSYFPTQVGYKHTSYGNEEEFKQAFSV